MGQVALDVGVVTPLIYYPVFYVFKESVQGAKGAAEATAKNQRSATEIISNAFSKYRANVKDDMVAFAKLWVPGDLIIYSLPIWLRLPVNHAVSFVWTCILSVMRGDGGKGDITGDGKQDVPDAILEIGEEEAKMR